MAKLNSKGLTLVELIVVIAIMLVLIGITAPALTEQINSSQAKRDTSHMNEVVSGIELALANQNIYDDIIMYSIENNYSCYADGNPETNTDANKVYDMHFNISPDIKAKIQGRNGVVQEDWWHYNDNARQASRTQYVPSGNMSGITITFSHRTDSGRKDEMAIDKGLINNMGAGYEKIDRTVTLDSIHANCKSEHRAKNDIDPLDCLYTRIKHMVTESVDASSLMYRNSEYTVFIRMAPSIQNYDGSYKDYIYSEVYSQYPNATVQVYGQWNGMYLVPGRAPQIGAYTPIETLPEPTLPTPAKPIDEHENDPTPEAPEDILIHPTANDLTYNGKAQELITLGSANYGTIYYRLESGKWSTKSPTGVDAGVYTVLYYVRGENGENSVIYSLPVTIKKADPVITIIGTDVDYDGMPHELIKFASTTGGFIEYRMDADDWTTDMYEKTDVGEYVVSYQVIGGTNYNDVGPKGVKAIIRKVAPEIIDYPKSTGIITNDVGLLTQNGELQDLIYPGVVRGGEFLYMLGAEGEWSPTTPAAQPSAVYTIFYYVKGDKNHYDLVGTGTSPIEPVPLDKCTTEIHDHVFVEYKRDEPKCLVDGMSYLRCKYYKRGCDAKDTKVLPQLGHNPTWGGTADCHTKCSRCGAVLTGSSAHVFTSKHFNVTCTTPARTQYSCECGYSYYVNDAGSVASGHEFAPWTNIGNLNHQSSCVHKGCDKTKTEPHNKVKVETSGCCYVKTRCEAADANGRGLTDVCGSWTVGKKEHHDGTLQLVGTFKGLYECHCGSYYS